MAYKVMMKGMSSWTAISADAYEQDGSGTRFRDSAGALVASFSDGQLTAVVPDTVDTSASEAGATDATDTAA